MKLRTMSSLASLLLFGLGANAATLDFTIPTGGFTVQLYNDAAGSDASGAITGAVPGGTLTGEAGFNSIVIDVDGEDLDIFINDVALGNPYFDADDGGKPGGLGSCSNLNASAQCVPNSDDNLTLNADETLRMDFWDDTTTPASALFGDFIFRDDNHNLINGTVSVTHDSGYSIINLVNGVGDLSIIGASGYLIFNDDGGAGSTTNYYISEANISAVPVPAAVWLFGSAIGALGWMRRKATT